MYANNSVRSVQYVRAAAALSVLICHCSVMWLRLRGYSEDLTPLVPLAAGVDLFFITSGFVMVISTIHGESGPAKSAGFLARRIIRIVPLYWVTSFLYSLFLDNWPTIPEILATAFFVPDDWGPINGIGWTLNHEMSFYALFAVALLLPRRFVVPAVCAATLAAGLFGWMVYYSEARNLQIRFWCDPIIIEFAFGCALGAVFNKGFVLPDVVRWLFLFVGFAALWYFPVTSPFPSNARFLEWGVPAAFIFAGAVFGPRQQEKLRMSLLEMIGDASYGVYLSHTIVLEALRALWDERLDRFDTTFALVVAALLIVAISILSYRFVEQPFTRLLRRTLLWS